MGTSTNRRGPTGVFHLWEAQLWQSNKSWITTPRGDVLQTPCLLPVPPLKPGAVAFSGRERVTSRASQGTAGSAQHDPTSERQSERMAGRGRNKGGHCCSSSLSCWGQPSSSGSATSGAIRCWHMPPHGNHATACVPNSKQPLNRPFNGFLPKATQFPRFQGIKNQCHKPLSQVL